MNATVQAVVSWRELKADIVILIVGVVCPLVSLIVDLRSATPRHFLQRSGAVMLVASGYLAYRSLARHYVKAERSIDREKWWITSKNQSRLDRSALALAIIGTLIWGYGDLLI